MMITSILLKMNQQSLSASYLRLARCQWHRSFRCLKRSSRTRCWCRTYSLYSRRTPGTCWTSLVSIKHTGTRSTWYFIDKLLNSFCERCNFHMKCAEGKSGTKYICSLNLASNHIGLISVMICNARKHWAPKNCKISAAFKMLCMRGKKTSITTRELWHLEMLTFI